LVTTLNVPAAIPVVLLNKTDAEFKLLVPGIASKKAIEFG